MKRIFTFSLLMLAFAMNAVAWEPVIKERHWFGMHEYYTFTDPNFRVDDFLDNVDFSSSYSDNSGSHPNNWTQNQNSTTYTLGNGLIGQQTKYTIGEGQNQVTFYSIDDENHLTSDYSLFVDVRWKGNYAYYTQTTKQKLPEGHYKLVFDVQNRNNATADITYDNYFYVQIGDNASNRVYDTKVEWMRGGTGWTTHTIEFDIDDHVANNNYSENITISLGYGNPNTDEGDLWHVKTPALFISNLELKKMTVSSINSSIIRNPNDSHIIEGIEVVNNWTGQDPPQMPKTTYYSWLDHKFRFSTNRDDDTWIIDKNNCRAYEGLGLKNTEATAFKILNLNAGDKFSVEYYLDTYDSAKPYLANDNNEMTGTVKDMTPDQGEASIIESKADYEVATAGNVQIFMPANAVIRSVTIQHAQYQKATATVTELTQEEQATYNGKGYRYTVTSPGVLEDKRGAVPYITMRFGAEKDMAFVRNLGKDQSGNDKYGVSLIIDETNDFDPSSAALQKPYRSYTADQMKDRLAGKEWSVFTTNLDEHGDEIFNDIYPKYGSYYYFFPEVNGKLIMEFYCEGSEETPAFWYKKRADGTFPQIGEQPQVTKETNLSGNSRTNGSNFYKFTVDVEKGGVYYLCSLPTNINHEHPIIRLSSYCFIPSFRVDPLYDVVTNGTQNYSNVVKIKGVTIDKFTNGFDGNGDVKDVEVTEGDGKKIAVLDNTSEMMLNGERAPRIKFLGNVKTATVQLTQATGSDDIYLEILNIQYKDGADINKGGAIVVNLDCPAGEAGFVLTVAYDAANAKWDADGKLRVPSTDNGTQVKRWDFYSGKGEKDELGTGQGWDLGKYGTASATDKDLWTTAPDSWKAKSKLFKEVNKHGGLTADWVDTYVNLTDGKNERFFKSVYDMEGDNADMIHETAGLVFISHANQLGIYNENDEPTTQFKDRYIGLMKGSKLRIPLLEAGDRIVLKMGTYNNENVTLGMTNAKDVSSEGITIGNNYIIGGSAPVSGDVKDAKGHVVPRGEYHIQAIADGDVDIEVVDGQLLKIYSIEIYCNAANNNADILTENEVKGNKKGVLFTDQDADGATKTVVSSLRYHGYQETATFEGIDQIRGNLDLGTEDTHKNKYVSETSTTTEPYCKVTTTLNKGDFGSYRAKMAVKTKDANNTYVTDYATGSMAVGYRETKPYPYTWDFTDLKKYAIKTGELDNNGTENGDVADMKTWNNYGLRVSTENADGCLFVSGGQLYAGAKMFPETKGIGIYHYNNKNQNGVMTITGDGTTASGGLQVNDNSASNESPLAWGFNVPSVKAGQAVYVHAKECGLTHYAKYLVNDPTDNFSFDLEGTDAGYIPLGWTCNQGDETPHISGTYYDLGTRVMTGFKGYLGKGLYWRNGHAAYTEGLYLKPGSYTLTFAMAAWKGEPDYKVEISKLGDTPIQSSNPYRAEPNADGNSAADLSSATLRTFTFDIADADNYIIKFSQVNNGWGEFLLLQCDLTTPEHDFEYTATDANDDKIFAMKLPADATDSDVKLCFQGYEVNKIAVATDQKTVNNFGWNTESRDHAIDPSLMSYMTGKDFRAYVVTSANVEENTVTLVRIDGGSGVDTYDEIENSNTVNPDSEKQTDKFYVPAAVENPNANPVVPNNGSINACIIRYVDASKAEDQQTVNIFNDGNGFHLFVPDMHDKEAAEAVDLTGNLLKARVTATTTGDSVRRDETIGGIKYNNYAFTSRHRNVVMGGDWKDDVQAFYRIASKGAGSDGNQAYLSIKASGNSASRSAEPANSSAVPQTYDIVFKDWSDLMTEKGDVNGDGMVTRPDIDVLSGYVTARYSNGLFKRMGDMNDDGRIDIVDMTLLIKKIMSE